MKANQDTRDMWVFTYNVVEMRLLGDVGKKREEGLRSQALVCAELLA
jgi:hypothetical protein